MFALNDDDVAGLYCKQNGLCALTGQPMTLDVGARDWTKASIDRVNPEGNYTLGNVHLVCWAINAMKYSLSVEQFGFWCKAVTLHALRQAEPDVDKPAV